MENIYTETYLQKYLHGDSKLETSEKCFTIGIFEKEFKILRLSRIIICFHAECLSKFLNHLVFVLHGLWKMILIFLGFQSSLIFDKQPLAHWCYLAKLQSENADIEDRRSCCKPVSRVIELWNTSGAKCTNNLLSCPPNQYPVELISFAEQIIEHSMK